VYLGLGAATSAWHVVALLLAYGLYFGLTEGTEKAMVADFAPASRRGTAFGWFHMIVGLGTLPASAIFGWIWEAAGSAAAFATGAALALAAAAALLTFVPRPPR
jgi:sugar phosphate permease